MDITKKLGCFNSNAITFLYFAFAYLIFVFAKSDTIYYNFIKTHSSLSNLTPAQVCGINYTHQEKINWFVKPSMSDGLYYVKAIISDINGKKSSKSTKIFVRKQ